MDRGTRWRLGALLAAVLASYLALLALGFTDRREMAASMARKSQRLRALGSPKLVVLGGSNALFGVDTRRLGEALGRPAVNMSTGAAVGLGYMLDKVEGALGPGDVVLVALEPSYFRQDPDLLTDGTLEVLPHDPDGPAYFLGLVARNGPAAPLRVLRSNAKIIGFLDNRLRPLFPRLPARLYQNASIDEVGDMTAHLGRASLGVAAPIAAEPERPFVHEGVKARLAAFRQGAEARGARVLLTWPSVMAAAYPAVAPQLEAAARAVDEVGLATRSAPRDHVYPDDCFYDTIFHLGARCRTIRTDALIEELRRGVRGAATP